MNGKGQTFAFRLPPHGHHRSGRVNLEKDEQNLKIRQTAGLFNRVDTEGVCWWFFIRSIIEQHEKRACQSFLAPGGLSSLPRFCGRCFCPPFAFSDSGVKEHLGQARLLPKP